MRAALAAYEDAGIRGLCEEGRWEAAIGALQSLDLRKLTQDLERSATRPAAQPLTAGTGLNSIGKG